MIGERDTKDLMRMQEQDCQVFENIITRIYAAVLQPGDICLDGGAANGLHTLPLARLVGPQGRVFSVEPIPSVARALDLVLREKGLRQVRLIQAALYHEVCTAQFTIVRNALSRSGINRTWYPFEPDIEEISVSTILIDDILCDQDTWRFCKLDLEGCEFRALQGGLEAIAKHSPLLVFERSVAAPTWYHYTPAEFFEFFSELGYETFDLFGRKLTPEDWHLPERPWYAIGVQSDSEDEEFVHERLPAILLELLEADRSPIAASSNGSAPVTGPFVWAAPNPVPGGVGAGTTVVHWDTGDGSIGEVYVSVNGDEERLFFRNARGSRSAPWINAWGTYEFRLYGEGDPAELLGSVTVTRRKQ
jgi:FkbM family methyltransferase